MLTAAPVSFPLSGWWAGFQVCRFSIVLRLRGRLNCGGDGGFLSCRADYSAILQLAGLGVLLRPDGSVGTSCPFSAPRRGWQETGLGPWA